MLNHDEILRIAQELEPLPPSCARLAALASEEAPDILEVVEIFRQDPVLTGRLLRLANSAAYGAPRTIGTVKEAVLRLGTTNVLGLAVAVSSKSKLETRIPAYGLQAGALWQHSLTAAMATGVLTIHMGGRIPPLSFSTALLHDLGKLVLGRLLTNELRDSCRRAVSEAGLLPFEAEAEILTVHHGEVAGIITQSWQLPTEIVSGVTYHHDPLDCSDPHAMVAYFANIVAKYVDGQLNCPPAEAKILGEVMDRLRITEPNLKQIMRGTAARLSELAPIYT